MSSRVSCNSMHQSPIKQLMRFDNNSSFRYLFGHNIG